MRRVVFATLLGVAGVSCALPEPSGAELVVTDLRGSDTGQADHWEGDTLISDTSCTDLPPLAGLTLHQACDELLGGRAHVGEDRIAATVFDDAECLVAAGFLPAPGDGGDVRLPSGGLGVVLRCAILAEPR